MCDHTKVPARIGCCFTGRLSDIERLSNERRRLGLPRFIGEGKTKAVITGVGFSRADAHAMRDQADNGHRVITLVPSHNVMGAYGVYID